MKALISALALAIVSTPAVAEPKPSQHPRIGQLAIVEFSHGSADLVVYGDTQLARDLGEVAGWARENPGGLIVLDGHADPTGPQRVNRPLSYDRAKAVVAWLIKLDVDPDQIVIAAFGETGPKSERQRRVVVWGTRQGLEEVAARSQERGEPLLTVGMLSSADLASEPGVAATR